MMVTDASKDDRFAAIPSVVDNPHIRFYASANLKSNDGFNVGTLCVYDTKPKELTEQQLKCLAALANQVSNIMELDNTLNEVRKQNSVLKEVARIESHELRQPVASIMGILSIIKESSAFENEECVGLLDLAVNQLDDRIRTVVKHINDHPESYIS
jgi:GAF domain-containing protein